MPDEKRCHKCQEIKPLVEFHRCSKKKVSDGHRGWCKICMRRDNQERYYASRQEALAYNKRHRREPHVRAMRAITDRRRRLESPEKYRARYIVSNALRCGKLTKQPCEVCGDERVESHHEDYSKPLEVKWLCRRHHREAHLGRPVGTAPTT